MKNYLIIPAVAVSLLIAVPSGAKADGPSLGSPIPDIESILGTLPAATPLRFPSIFGVPSAVGPQGGTGFVALTLVNPRGGVSGEGADGDLSVGYTVGDAADSIGLTFGVGITSLEDFAEDGAFFLSASRQVSANANSSTFIGLQAANLLAWGDADEDDEKLSASVSHLTSISSASGSYPMQFTVGYGADNTNDDDGSGELDDGFFVGLGMGLSENVSGSISATETQLNLGLGFSVPSVPNLGISAGVFDVSDNTDRRQFSVTAAFSF